MSYGHNEPSEDEVVCIFCCTPIIAEEDDHQNACYRWRTEFRAIYNEQGEWNSPKVSGIGDRCIDDAVPVDFAKHRKDYGVDASVDLRMIWKTPWDNPDFPIETGSIGLAWGFFGHASCWVLFYAVFDPGDACLTALNNFCRSSRSHSGIVALGLDYGLVPIPSHPVFGREYGEEADFDATRTFAELEDSPRTQIYQADPLVLGLGPVLRRGCNSRRSSRLSKASNLGIPSFMDVKRANQALADAQSDCFIRLPEELRLLILAHLPSCDVLRAKIASAALAHTLLGSPFWKSRFNIGQDFHCIFERPVSILRGGNWKELFEASRSRRRNPSFQNRRRIWNALLHLRDILTRMLDRPLYGKSLRSAFEKDEQRPPRVKRFVSAMALIAPVHAHPHEWNLMATGSATFWKGCKALFSRLAVIPTDITDMGVTLVHHDDQTFIAGLIFQSMRAGDICIGYVNRESSVYTNFQGNALAGLRISVSQMGLCGIRAVFETGLCSNTLGSMDTLPRSQLMFAKRRLWTLMCDFDGFKMLRLGICEVDRRNQGPPITGRCAFHRDDYSWSPDIPDAIYSLSEPQVLKKERLLQQETFLPRVTCLFGGEKGELLRKVTKLTFWFLDVHVVGIEFHYGDDSTILGQRVNTERSWHSEHALDGPSGEVITDFRVPRYSALTHLNICTNFGRVIKVSFMDSPHWYELVSIKCSPSATILGIYVYLDDCGHLAVLGVISKIC